MEGKSFLMLALCQIWHIFGPTMIKFKPAIYIFYIFM